MADHLVDLVADPAELAEERGPGARAELDAVLEDGGRVGRGELVRYWPSGKRMQRFQAPAAERVELRRGLGDAADQPSTLLG